jgi:hypothetical protein
LVALPAYSTAAARAVGAPLAAAARIDTARVARQSSRARHARTRITHTHARVHPDLASPFVRRETPLERDHPSAQSRRRAFSPSSSSSRARVPLIVARRVARGLTTGAIAHRVLVVVIIAPARRRTSVVVCRRSVEPSSNRSSVASIDDTDRSIDETDR